MMSSLNHYFASLQLHRTTSTMDRLAISYYRPPGDAIQINILVCISSLLPCYRYSKRDDIQTRYSVLNDNCGEVISDTIIVLLSYCLQKGDSFGGDISEKGGLVVFGGKSKEYGRNGEWGTVYTVPFRQIKCAISLPRGDSGHRPFSTNEVSDFFTERGQWTLSHRYKVKCSSDAVFYLPDGTVYTIPMFHIFRVYAIFQMDHCTLSPYSIMYFVF
jgi:hypothetical protein